jgi:hypothetical protein
LIAPRARTLVRMSYELETRWPGVLAQHADDCPARDGGPCDCGPLGYRAAVTDRRDRRSVLGPPVGTPERAGEWRREQEAAMEAWEEASANGDTVDEVIAEFLDAARSGRARDTDGEPYDPDALNDLRWALQGHVSAELGSMPIADVRGTELRRLVRRLDERGLPAARMRSIVAAARALLRHAARRGLVAWSAADTLVLGEDDGAPRRASVARPQPAVAAVPAVPGMVPDQVIWMVLKIVSIVFALIALVLVAESV